MSFIHPIYLQQIATAKKHKSKRLDLSQNHYCGPFQLQEIPESILEIEYLEELVLKNNQLQELPEWLTKLPKLKLIDIRGNPLQNNKHHLPLFVNKWQYDKLKLPVNEVVGWKISRITDIVKLNDFPCLLALDANNTYFDNYYFLFSLTQLQTLYLRENEIQDASFLTGLKNLRTLDISSNDIEYVSFLSCMSQLQSLDLSYNQIQDINFITKLTLLKSLDLSNNQVQDYIALQHLKQLKSLVLKNNQIQDLKPISKLNQLQSLDLNNNQIQDVNPISKLTQLKSLNLINNQVKDINSISKLTQLQSLNLNNNKIQDSNFFSELIKLKILQLSNNQIQDLNPISKLIQMQFLDLSNNKIKDVNSISKLTQLQSLDLSYNQIQDVNSISKLTQLKSLNLRNNQVKDAKFISKLTQLQSLDLNNNQIQDVNSISKLTQLQSLDLSNNQIQDVNSISKLTQLQSLDLSNNQIQNVNSISKLTQLKSLNLRNNQIQDASFLDNMAWLTYIDLYDNPLEEPPLDVLIQDIHAIRNYFKEKKEQGEVSLYEAKLLIVGEGGAGKTTLARKLIDPRASLPKDNETTRGIEVLKWIYKSYSEKDDKSAKFRANIWDFGGQEIYHETHQFFLTKRSLYIFIEDTRKEDGNLDYWLQIVELLSDDSPLIIVQNQKQNRFKQRNFSAIKSRFKNIKEIYSLNLSSDKEKLSVLTQEIQHQIRKLPLIGNKLPQTWVNIREILEKDGRDYIGIEEYFQICARNKVDSNERALFLSSYYHDLGVFLHFQEDTLLRELVILKPEWGTDAVYKVLDTELVKKKFGHFTHKDIEQIWFEKKYKSKIYELLQLMVKFKLCYKVTNQDLYIAPLMLQIEQPKYKWETRENLFLRFEYDFMPKGMLARFIVEMHHLIANQDLVWKEGVILKRGSTIAEIRETYGKKEIKVRIQGDDKKGLMTLITDGFEQIHETYSQLKYKKLIPCNCIQCKDSQTPNFYEYDDLYVRKVNRKDTIECKVSYMDVPVIPLIEDVWDERMLIKNERERWMTKDRMHKEDLEYVGNKIEEVLDRKQLVNQINIDNKNENIVKSETNVTVNIAVKNESVLNLQGTLEAIKNEMLDELEDEKEQKKLAKEIKRVEDAMQEVKALDNKEKVPEKIGSLKKVHNFLDKLSDTGTKAGKAFKAVENGYGHLQDMAKFYNGIAEWCALPQVPKLFLKKEEKK